MTVEEALAASRSALSNPDMMLHTIREHFVER